MPPNPLLSIIVPNFNGSKYLPASLESICNQTYQPLEIVVVDDCSTDQSTAIIERFSQEDPRIQLFRNPENLGVSTTRRRGIERSSGQFLTTLDSDDLLMKPTKLEREMEILLDSADADTMVVYSSICHISPEGSIVGRPLNPSNAVEGSLFRRMITRSIPIPRDMIFSRRLYEASGGYDPSIDIYEDWDLKLRLARLATFKFTGEDGIGYRIHGTGLSSNTDRNKLWLERVFRKNTEGLPEVEALWRELNGNMRPNNTFKRLIKRFNAAWKSLTN